MKPEPPSSKAGATSVLNLSPMDIIHSGATEYRSRMSRIASIFLKGVERLYKSLHTIVLNVSTGIDSFSRIDFMVDRELLLKRTHKPRLRSLPTVSGDAALSFFILSIGNRDFRN